MMAEEESSTHFAEDSAADSSLERIPLLWKMSLVAASILRLTRINLLRPPSASASASAWTATSTRSNDNATPNNFTSSLLGSIPKDVLARDILGFLTDKAVKIFLDSLGEERLNSSSCSELRRQFCSQHGSMLEDPETFYTSTNDEDNDKNKNNTNTITKPCQKRSCPECHAQEENTKRCNGCKVFYRRFRDLNSKAFPSLWCQNCDQMAFCNNCLTNEEDGCGSEVVASGALLGGAFGRKPLQGSSTRQKYCQGGRISCYNYCCPNVFTNTMCGEFVCDDCADERLRLLKDNNSSGCDGDEQQQQQHDPVTIGVETCEECGKSTCLDPNCLVCADFRLKHFSCGFSAEDAYKFDPWGILLGSKTNGSNSTSDLSTKLRQNLSDGVVWILVLLALQKMWWFQHQHQQQHEEYGDL
jgi:hypothetical protein